MRCASMPIVILLTTSDLMRPIRIPTSAGRGAERPTMGSSIRCPIRQLCCRPSLQELPRWSSGPQMEAKLNTLAQAGVRRNRLKNNTTRLSPAPDQAICNCWHKRTLAGYPTVGNNCRYWQQSRCIFGSSSCYPSQNATNPACPP